MLSRRRGQVLVILAIAIFALLGMAALAVDLGHLWSVRHELQRSADAGALAGASRFIPPDTGDWADTLVVQPEAEARARDFASRDLVSDRTLKPAVADNEIIVSFPQTDRIKVVTQRPVPLFFARIFGRQIQAVTAEAVAEAREASKNVSCIVPWGMPLPWKDNGDDEPNGDFDSDDVIHPDPLNEEECNQISTLITPYDTVNHQVSEPVSPRDQYLCQGGLRILKPGKPSDTLESGHFFGLDFSSIIVPGSCPEGVTINSGASFYKYMIKHPCECDTNISVTDPLPTIDLKPGDMVGPTTQAVAPLPKGDGMPDPSLMARDPDAYWDMDANKPVSGDAQWQGDNWQGSPRIVKVPVYDPSTPLPQGKSEITVERFVGFWIQDIVVNPKGQGTVVGRYVTLSGDGEANPEGGGGPVVKILRLVK